MKLFKWLSVPYRFFDKQPNYIAIQKWKAIDNDSNQAYGFASTEEFLQDLDENVAKSERDDWVLYRKVEPEELQPRGEHNGSRR